MENPRPEKVAVVEEVRQRLASANASVVTEYRGLTVAQLAELRKNLAAVGDYKIYKNTLVRLAVAGSEHEGLTELLTGPTAIAFVNGEISAAAKTLRDFARTYPALIVKGGLFDGSPISNQDFGRLADLPSRDVLLARFAGALAAPLQQLAGLLQALPRNLAYGLSALIEERGGVPAPAEAAAPIETETSEPAPAASDIAEAGSPELELTESEPTDPAEAGADADAAEGPADETPADETPADETPADETPASEGVAPEPASEVTAEASPDEPAEEPADAEATSEPDAGP
jgi:large subunit ribosomal protein L10